MSGFLAGALAGFGVGWFLGRYLLGRRVTRELREIQDVIMQTREAAE